MSQGQRLYRQVSSLLQVFRRSQAEGSGLCLPRRRRLSAHSPDFCYDCLSNIVLPRRICHTYSYKTKLFTKPVSKTRAVVVLSIQVQYIQVVLLSIPPINRSSSPGAVEHKLFSRSTKAVTQREDDRLHEACYSFAIHRRSSAFQTKTTFSRQKYWSQSI